MVSDRKSTRLNSSHTEIYTLSLHDALPIYVERQTDRRRGSCLSTGQPELLDTVAGAEAIHGDGVLGGRPYFRPQDAGDADRLVVDVESLFVAHMKAVAVLQVALEIDRGADRAQHFQHRGEWDASGSG